jgi:hypothetical protein
MTKGVSIALSFHISLLLFKIRNLIDLQLVYSVRTLPLACPAFFIFIPIFRGEIERGLLFRWRKAKRANSGVCD